MDRDGTNLPHPSSLFIVRTLQELCCLNISAAAAVYVLAKEEARSIKADIRISSTVQNSNVLYVLSWPEHNMITLLLGMVLACH